MKVFSKQTFLIIFLLAKYFKYGAVNTPSVQLKLLSFQENKGQVSDQNYKPRSDILFSGTDGKLVYHLKQNGISYQLSKVVSWKKAEFYPPLKGVSEERGMGGARRAVDEGMSEGRGMKYKNESNQFNELSIYRIDINWLNCNTNATIINGKIIEGYDNFYSEACPQGALEVKSYSDVTYQNLYPGIDLKWYAKNGDLKYDYNVSAGADYTQIALELKGAQSIRVNELGQLIINTPLGELIEEAPIVKQENKILPSYWKINGQVVSFQIIGVDSNKPFTIDPLVRLWGTYYGGNGNDWVGTAYTDNSGNLYLCGGTNSNNLTTIATTGAYQTTFGGGIGWGDCFLVKFNSSGQRLWGTYYGGAGQDFSSCCVLDANGDVYISGGTSSNSNVMTTTGCHQPMYGGGQGGTQQDAFLAKFSSTGLRIWSTYFGGAGDEWASAISADNQNNIYITGYTSSISTTVIASPGCHQSIYGGTSDGFLAKFNTLGQRLWSTYYGGNGGDASYACITDVIGNIYIGGITASTNSISTSGCYQPNYGGGIGSNLYGVGDAFLVKFNSSGLRQWGTYYGGIGDEFIYYCAADVSGNIYFTGWTSSPTTTVIANAGGFQTNYGGGAEDAMIVKFDAAGVRQWGTYYGGTGNEDYCCCVVDNLNSYLYISGVTSTSVGTNVISSCAYQSNFGGGLKDAFLTKFNLQGTRIWGTYYGGTGDEDWSCLAVDGSGSAYLIGETTNSANNIIASAGSHQTGFGGGAEDAFIVKFGACSPTVPPAISNTIACKGQIAVLSSAQQCGLKWYSDSLLTNLVYTGNNFTTNPIFNDTTFYYVDVSCGNPSPKAIAHLSVSAGPSISVNASPSITCKGEAVALIPTGAVYYNWTNFLSTYSITVSPSVITIYTVSGSNYNGGCTTKTTVTVLVNECLELNENVSSENLGLKIYPNPNNGSFTLSGNKTAQISISNELGQIIKTLELLEANQFKIEINDLTEGLYFVSSKTDAATPGRKLIVLK